MDTASLIGALASVDVGSLVDPLFYLVKVVDGIFVSITGSLNMGGALGEAAAGSVQSVLGSVAGL
ncbi:hypothetical protein ACH49M_31065 [Rhodococcus qingshengii]|uniref:Uncharacterized protein n=2 Tax=Rhodococcus erythropolis group TaxID=2840174 RepID=A0AB38RGL4_RHOSG|nr:MULTISPECIES: hypothetical protein [Rhodococcus]NHE67161.1 hypothetical protein [Rhodococcus sp. D-46]ALU72346.1 hypothetical protein H351_25150 [Rhodococcus erythropolis R138]KZL34512.1 hypothetical protein A3852_01530 [Rhodococcus qingshengii]MBJ7478127.1 hypothetical protein [Rhodococcus sp. (in: high G+C Gram-positive bacteria)]MBQ9055323.1 hypothetical protein [Rhodococcus sp. (in: high G+C Gram-positive bacteria)]